MDYSIFPINDTPQYLLDRHPFAATFTVNGKSFRVYGDSDIVIDETDDIVTKGFNHVFNAENKGLTVAQLRSKANSRISQQQSFKLSRAQGRYMWDQEWKQTEDI